MPYPCRADMRFNKRLITNKSRKAGFRSIKIRKDFFDSHYRKSLLMYAIPFILMSDHQPFP